MGKGGVESRTGLGRAWGQGGACEPVPLGHRALGAPTAGDSVREHSSVRREEPSPKATATALDSGLPLSPAFRGSTPWTTWPGRDSRDGGV